MSTNKWTGNSIGDQKGRVVIVTGASSGIGLEAASVLAGKNAEIIIAVRNLDKGKAAQNMIKNKFSYANVRIMELDLADLSSVRAFAENFLKNFSRLDLLINNAGVMIPPYEKTADQFELQMGTNHLGHFALTCLLMEAIEATPESRIINVSSMAHTFGNINFDDLHWEKRKYKKWTAYGDSKIANLYFTLALQQRLKDKNSHVIVAAAHPGWAATKLQRHTGLITILNYIFAQTVSMGALPTLYAATAPDVMGGDFYGPGGFMDMRGYPVKASSNALSKKPELAEKLWEISEKLTGATYNI